MSYTSLKTRTDTRLVTVVKILPDYCTYNYADTTAPSACTVNDLSGTVMQCYNTRNTCQKLADYATGKSTYTGANTPLLFCGTGDNLSGYMPLIDKIDITPVKLDYLFGMGVISTIKITLNDSLINDSLAIDKYEQDRSGRSGYVKPSGTFWQRFRARNLYLAGKKIEVLTGFKQKGQAFNESDCIKRTYYIDKFTPLDANNQVQIIAKDPLNLSKDDRAIAPMSLGVKLTSAVNASTTTFPISIDKADPFTSGTGYALVDDEIVSFTHAITTGNITVTRAALSTTASTHASGAELKIIYYKLNTSPELIIKDLLENYVPNFDASWITIADWTSIINSFNSGYQLTAYIAEPTGVDKLIREILETCLLWLWWDEVTEKIQLKSVYPETLATSFREITDSDLISIKIKEMSNKWYSQVAFYFAPRTKFATSVQDMSMADVSFDSVLEEEQPLKKQIVTRWLDSGDALTASDASYKLMKTTSKRPLEFSLVVDISLNFNVGDTFNLTTSEHTGYAGEKQTIQLRIASVKEDIKNGRLSIIAFPINVNLRNFRICADTYSTAYTAATSSEQDSYGFLCDNATSLMSNGDDPYTLT